MTSEAVVCEHKWTIVYLYKRPVGIACENCTRVMGVDADAPIVDRGNLQDLSLEPHQKIRLVNQYAMGVFVVQDYRVDRHFKERTRVSIELVQDDLPF